MNTTPRFDLYAPDPARRWATLAALSLMLGWLLAGCGDVTATMVPPAAAEPNERGVVETLADSGAQDAPPWLPTQSPDADGIQDLPPVRDGSAGEGPTPEVAPEHPALHCAGGEYRATACKPGCGTCAKVGEASTFATGCWLPDDFHCVASCSECR